MVPVTPALIEQAVDLVLLQPGVGDRGAGRLGREFRASIPVDAAHRSHAEAGDRGRAAQWVCHVAVTPSCGDSTGVN